MSPKITQQPKQKGSALVIAIFVIIVMSLLGSALVKMLGGSAEAIVYEVSGIRAFHAAQSGVQWRLRQIFPLNSAAVACDNLLSEPDISNVNGLNECVVDTVCDNFSHDGVMYYTITSTGTCDVTNEIHTSRTVQVTARAL